MRSAFIAALFVAALAGCRTVVTTTSEILPSRYAVLEFTRPVSHDSIVAFAKRALTAENLKVQSVDAAAGVVKAGPVKLAATSALPEVEADVTVSAATKGATTTVRIYASGPVKQTEKGGVDARLVELAQRIENRLDAMIGH
jgi:hypothetical protein